jgi:hypothetical protein
VVSGDRLDIIALRNKLGTSTPGGTTAGSQVKVGPKKDRTLLIMILILIIIIIIVDDGYYY